MSQNTSQDGNVQGPSEKSLDFIQKQLEPQIIKLGSKNMRKIKIVQKSCLLGA